MMDEFVPSEIVDSRWRRRTVRIFAVIVIGLIANDSLPTSASRSGVRRMLSAALQRVGLSQGEWKMFAPNPVINNGWYSAEIRSLSGEVAHWDSPIWAGKNGWDKFVNFRQMNYYNRLPSPRNSPATFDLADYLARKRSYPAASITLYRNQFQINMPEDGSLPSREETIWTFSTVSIVNQNYQP